MNVRDHDLPEKDEGACQDGQSSRGLAFFWSQEDRRASGWRAMCQGHSLLSSKLQYENGWHATIFPCPKKQAFRRMGKWASDRAADMASKLIRISTEQSSDFLRSVSICQVVSVSRSRGVGFRVHGPSQQVRLRLFSRLN